MFTYFMLPTADANPTDANSACSWYTIHRGEALGHIAARHHTTAWHLAIVNRLRNINFIVAGRSICIPLPGGYRAGAGGARGNCGSGGICWYAYSNLEYSTRGQVSAQLRRAAIRHGIPVRLALAIGWQESGWTQHVIARDGGIGVMQIMPYTASSLNGMAGKHMNPYRLRDNIDLGAFYLRILWKSFHGNLPKTISAYNEGGWNVTHRGIFNWNYVNSVMAIMQRVR